MTATNFLTYNASGAVIGTGFTPDGTVPDDAVACSTGQAANWQQYTVAEGQIVALPAAQIAAMQASAAAIQSAQSALAAGVAIVSASTPALNGTYAVDQLSQMDIIAIETSISAGKGFPGGATAFNYPDVTGAMHAFTQANFTDFAAAVRDYVYALKSVIAGSSSTLPAASTTIA